MYLLSKVNRFSDYVLRWVLARLPNLTKTTLVLLATYVGYKFYLALKIAHSLLDLHAVLLHSFGEWERYVLPLVLTLGSFALAAMWCQKRSWAYIHHSQIAMSTAALSLILVSLVVEVGFISTAIGIGLTAFLLVRRWNTLMILSIGLSLLCIYFEAGASVGRSNNGGTWRGGDISAPECTLLDRDAGIE
jgi:hypothetical protein